MNHRSLFRGRIALVRLDRRVERGVARERLEHGELILHAVHFGAHEMPVHLLGNAPPGGVDGLQAALQCRQRDTSPGRGAGSVVGHSRRTRRRFERAPFGEQAHQLRIGATGSSRLGTGHGRPDEARGERNETERADECAHAAKVAQDAVLRDHGPTVGSRPWPASTRRALRPAHDSCSMAILRSARRSRRAKVRAISVVRLNANLWCARPN